jgi:zinc protease
MKRVLPLLAVFFLSMLIVLTGCLEQEFKFKECVLSNGLRVLTKEIKDTDVVALDIYVGAGSADENEENNGISHFIEHMLFKGTSKRQPGEASRLIESVGGHWNGATSRDFTHYYVVVPKRSFDLAIEYLADLIMNPLFDESELARERLVVLEEIRRSQDNPTSELWTLAYRTAFKSHPYRLPILGSKGVVEKIKRQEMLGWYHTHYVPNNMTLVICGDFKKREILSKVREAFSGFRARPLPQRVRASEPLKGKMELVTEERDISRTYMVISFFAPGIKSPRDVYAMDVLLYLLGRGRGSRLHQAIREQKQLASHIDASFLTQREPGIFIIYAISDYKKTDKLTEAIIHEIEKLRDELVSTEELHRAKSLLTSEYVFGNETALDLASTVGFYDAIAGSLDFARTYLDKIKQVTPEDISRVVRKYFNTENYTIILLKPRTTTAPNR